MVLFLVSSLSIIIISFVRNLELNKVHSQIRQTKSAESTESFHG